MRRRRKGGARWDRLSRLRVTVTYYWLVVSALSRKGNSSDFHFPQPRKASGLAVSFGFLDLKRLGVRRAKMTTVVGVVTVLGHTCLREANNHIEFDIIADNYPGDIWSIYAAGLLDGFEI